MVEKILQYLNNRPDKVMHFSGGYILCTLFPIAPKYGLLIAAVAGLAKEVYDYYHQDKHTVDKWDMFVTWLGGIVGFVALLIK